MDFDLELAKSKTSENPVYYIQYAHARICSVLNQATQKGIDLTLDDALDLSKLNAKQEVELIKLLSAYSDILLSAAKAREPHQIAYYLRDLATGLHSYYGACDFITQDKSLTKARLTLISAVLQILKNGLLLLGVDAPKSM